MKVWCFVLSPIRKFFVSLNVVMWLQICIEFFIDELMISCCVPCWTIGSVCRKSPPKTMSLPPKGVFGLSIRCRKVRSTHSNTFLCSIGASSQKMIDASMIALPSRHLLVRLQYVFLSTVSGMPNPECAVCPWCKMMLAMPDEATTTAGCFRCPRVYSMSVL